MIATTSGAATGEAPAVQKVAAMRDAIGDNARLAVASGMTADNVVLFSPYVNDFLVATGVSHDMYHFDEVALTRFVDVVRKGAGKGLLPRQPV